MVDPILSAEWREAEVSAPLRGTLVYLEALTRTPLSVDASTIDAALASGASPGALEQAALMVALFSYMNRMVDAFGADVTPEQAEQIAGFLDTVGGSAERLSRTRPWQRLGGAVPPQLTAQLESIRSGDGDCPVEIRQSIEAHVAARSGGQRDPAGPLSPAILDLIDTLARDAHGVQDAHIAALKEEDWSEPAIYEMVFIASFATGLGRMERAATLLRDR